MHTPSALGDTQALETEHVIKAKLITMISGMNTWAGGFWESSFLALLIEFLKDYLLRLPRCERVSLLASILELQGMLGGLPWSCTMEVRAERWKDRNQVFEDISVLLC